VAEIDRQPHRADVEAALDAEGGERGRRARERGEDDDGDDQGPAHAP
jgi:hypothetical protein